MLNATGFATSVVTCVKCGRTYWHVWEWKQSKLKASPSLQTKLEITLVLLLKGNGYVSKETLDVKRTADQGVIYITNKIC